MVVGGLMRLGVARRVGAEVLHSKKLQFKDMMDQSDAHNALKKAVVVTMSGEVCVSVRDVRKKEIKHLRHNQELTHILPYCLITL